MRYVCLATLLMLSPQAIAQEITIIKRPAAVAGIRDTPNPTTLREYEMPRPRARVYHLTEPAPPSNCPGMFEELAPGMSRCF